MSNLKSQLIGPSTSKLQSDRIADFKAAFAEDKITKDQYDELMQGEASVSNYITVYRVAAAGLAGLVAFFLLW